MHEKLTLLLTGGRYVEFECVKFCQNGGSNKFPVLGHDYYSTVHV